MNYAIIPIVICSTSMENIDERGRRFYVFWINLPAHNNKGERVIQCIGIKIKYPNIMKKMIEFWKFFKN